MLEFPYRVENFVPLTDAVETLGMHRSAHVCVFPDRVEKLEPVTDAVETLGMHCGVYMLEIVVRTVGCDFMLNNINMFVFVL